VKGRMARAVFALVAGMILAGCFSSSPSLAVRCSGPLHLTKTISSAGKPVEVTATFKRGITLKKASHFAEFVIELNIEKCAPFTQIQPEDGRLILSVLATSSERRHYRSYVISYLESTGMFSSVSAAGSK